MQTCVLGYTTWLCNQLTNASSYDSNMSWLSGRIQGENKSPREKIMSYYCNYYLTKLRPLRNESLRYSKTLIADSILTVLVCSSFGPSVDDTILLTALVRWTCFALYRSFSFWSCSSESASRLYYQCPVWATRYRVIFPGLPDWAFRLLHQYYKAPAVPLPNPVRSLIVPLIEP